MSPSDDAADYVWHPGADHVERANVTRLARRHGLADLEALRARSVADVAWYWGAAVEDLGLPFSTPYDQVLDVSRGVAEPDWYVGGQLNVVDACVSRWSHDASARDRVAVVHETEDGTVTRLTFAELDDAVARAAAGLRALGIGRGDAVALYLPMAPEAVISLYAIARLGAVAVPLFSGFAAGAIASRLDDAEVRAVVVAQESVRRRRTVAMTPPVREAARRCPSVRHLVVVGETDGDGPGPEEISWTDLVGHAPDSAPPEPMASTDTLLLAYTSGTTGRPKGAVHTHAGFLVKTASEVAYSFDVGPGGVFCWVTDMGWIMGPLSIIGTHANGATVVLYEGSPDVPGPERLWDLVERHRVTMLGVSPTLIRTLRSRGADAGEADLSSVHTLGSTGEPWDAESYAWLARDVFAERVPIINFSGGTEVGGSFLAPYPVEPIRSCSLGGPSLGMDVDVVDASGEPVRGATGELVCRQPWPAMTRGIWRDRERYLEAYWSTFPGMWRHGDHARVDPDGQWFLLGRSDDVVNVAGKRLAPAEVEAVLIGHPDVAEAAAVGVPDPTKGETVWVFWVPRAGVDPEGDLTAVSSRLGEMVAEDLGKPFAPSKVRVVTESPRRARPRSCVAPCGPRPWARNPGTSPVPRTRARSTGSGRPWAPPTRWPRRDDRPVRRGRRRR